MFNVIYSLCINDYEETNRHWGHWVDLEDLLYDLKDIYNEYYSSDAQAVIEFVDTVTADTIFTITTYKRDIKNASIL